MSRRPTLELTFVAISLTCVGWSGVGRTQPGHPVVPAHQAPLFSPMRVVPTRPSPGKASRGDLELWFGKGKKDVSEQRKKRTDELRSHIEPKRTDAQRAAIAKAQATGLVVGHGAPKLSNPVMTSFAKLVDEHVKIDGGLLRGAKVVALQHLLGSTGGLLRGFVELGVKPVEVMALGKRYSQHDDVIDELTRDGFRVRPAGHESPSDLIVQMDDFGLKTNGPRAGYAKLGPPDRHFSDKKDRATEIDLAVEQISREVAREWAKGSKQKILVLDDGGELIERIQRQHPELHQHIVAVEQTRKGIRRVQKLALSFPVIDVAQTWAKLKFESPMIGRSIAKTTVQRLVRIEDEGQVLPRRMLSISYGAVGGASSEALREAGLEVDVYDRAPEAREAAKKAGFHTFDTLDDALAHSDITLSMTGETVLDGAALRKLPDGALVINGASSSTEFMPNMQDMMRGSVMNSVEASNGHALVFGRYRSERFAMGSVKDDRRLSGGGTPAIRFDLPVRVSEDGVHPTKNDREILLVNQGEVINFDGSVDPIPPRYIQLTRGLLFLGSIQAMKTTQPGIHALSDDVQRSWVDTVTAELAQTGESLEHPVF